MKRIALAFLLIATGVAQAGTFVDQARVRSVEPQYHAVQVPRQECRSRWVTEAAPAGGNLAGVAIGAVAGGVVGNQVGKGHGREAATAAGAVLGALAGQQIASRSAPPPVQREVRECQTVMDVQQQLTGYRVTYEYGGREQVAVLPQQPGRTLPVRVSIEPAGGEYHRR